MRGCGRPGRVTPTKGAGCSSTPRRQRLAIGAGAGRRARRPARLVAAGAGRRGQLIVGALAGARRRIAGRPGQRPSRFADAGIDAAAHRRAKTRSGAGATVARTGTSASPRTRTRTRCRWRSATRASTSSPIQARTATTASPHGGRTSGRRSRTTPSSSAARTSPPTVARSCGCATREAREIEVVDDGDIARWTAEHDGYASLDPPALHRRSVLLDRASRSIDIIDEIEGGRHDVRLAFHFGPEVQVKLEESCAILSWPGASGPGRPAWSCRPGCCGACIAAKPSPSSAGTLPAWAAAFPPSASSAADAACPGSRWPRGWNSSKPAIAPESAVSRRLRIMGCIRCRSRVSAPEIQAEAR